MTYYREPVYANRDNRYDYYYSGGYGYQVDPTTQLVAALIPLLGGALGIDQPLPAGYDAYNLPTQYRPLYPEDSAYTYRYGDSAIYRVDRSSDRIVGIPALLAQDFRVGQAMPAGYDAYNVPYDYRDRYYDDADYLYRYNDGEIYRIDADSRLVMASVPIYT